MVFTGQLTQPESPKQRKKFDTSLKLEVVRIIKEQGLSVQHVNQNMAIGQTAIRRWVAQYQAEQSGQPEIGNTLTAEQQHIRHLEVENRQLRLDVDILKSLSLLCPRVEMSYSLVGQLQEKAIPLSTAAAPWALAVQAHEARNRSAKLVLCKASVHLKAAFTASHQSYGSRCLVTAKATQGM